MLRYIREHRLIPFPQKVLVAVSGGADSVCLLHTLVRIQTELQITLHIAHLNHQLRGEEAEADALYVAGLARKLGLPATIERRDVAGYQAEHGLSPEEAAREMRYTFLAQTALAVGAERVAVGHTLNDQVETILLHVIRGTGISGLRGLRPCQVLKFGSYSLTVIRPLLNISREETEACCSRLQAAPCLDTSNLSFSFLRNRIRHELIPLLKDYNPGISGSLLRISRIAGDNLSFLEEAAAAAWKETVSREGGTLVFAREPFRKLAPAVQRELIRKGFETLLGTLKDIEARHIEEIMDALGKPAGRRLNLPEGLIFGIEYDRYLLGTDLSEMTPFPELTGEQRVEIPGETPLPGWTVRTGVFPREHIPPEYSSPDRFTACLDGDLTGDEIYIRARRRGDRFQPLGMDRVKKVGEFMVDARIPRTWRDRIPVFATPHQIVWIAGWRIDERVKITPETRRVVCIKAVRTPE